MNSTEPVSLLLANASHAPLLSNLLEFYIHDLCDLFPSVELGADGRFGYPKLALYWSEPERRFAYLIRCGQSIAGFALVTRGSPASSDPEVFDIAEFFVLRNYRRRGVGRQAALLLWQSTPGSWTVRVSARNPNALAYWKSVIAEFTQGAARVRLGAEATPTWHVFDFRSDPSSAVCNP